MANGRKEKGFSLGFFDEAYLQQAPIAIVESEDGEIVAFANIIQPKTKRVATIDLCVYDFERHLERYYGLLLCSNSSSISKRKESNTLIMGMAPLANVGTEEDSFLEEKVANLVYVFAQLFLLF